MHEPHGPRDELIERLQAFGRQPVEPSLQSRHLTAIAGLPAPAGRSLRSAVASRVKIAAAVFGGFLLGTTGLASAGALGPLQPIAASVVEKTTPLEVPQGAKDKAAKASKANGGTERYYGSECAVVDGKPARNRGQYLQQQRKVSNEAFQAAKQTNCGKPLSSVQRPGGTDDAEAPKSTPGADENEGRRDCVDNGSGSTGKPDCTPPAPGQDGDDKGKAEPKDEPAQPEGDDEDGDVSGKGGERGPEKRPEDPGSAGKGKARDAGVPVPDGPEVDPAA